MINLRNSQVYFYLIYSLFPSQIHLLIVLGCPPLTNFGVYIRWTNENVTDLLKV